jgi:hypothetical protein
MIAVDTNVLIYACDQAGPRRQKIALDLITSVPDGVLLWQVACEFLSASRKLSTQGFTPPTPGIASPSSGICCHLFRRCELHASPQRLRISKPARGGTQPYSCVSQLSAAAGSITGSGAFG